METPQPINLESKIKPSSQSLRILVVDDSHDSATNLSMLMEMMGNRVRTAHDGIEALLLGREFQPDVVLLDIGLPRLSGYDVARKIRQESWGQRVTLIAVTGWGQAEDKDRSREAGFDHHLVKPVDPADLSAILRRTTVASL